MLWPERFLNINVRALTVAPRALDNGLPGYQTNAENVIPETTSTVNVISVSGFA
jgi:hypothetical protein